MVCWGWLCECLWLSPSLLFYHLVNHLCLEFLTDFKQFVHILPIDSATIVDKDLIFSQVSLVADKQVLDVIVFESETELQRQKVITHKCHQQYQVINNLLNVRSFQLFQDVSELLLKIFPQNVNHDEFELFRLCLTINSCSSPVWTHWTACVLLNQTDVLDA